MAFKFEKLRVWQDALAYTDLVYSVAELLPDDEKYNLTSQMKRAATSIHLNIAEGSTGQTDAEQARFLGMAVRSLYETVACLHQAIRRNQIPQGKISLARKMYANADGLARSIQAMRSAISPDRAWVREEQAEYHVEPHDLTDDAWMSSIVSRQSSAQPGAQKC